MAFENACVLFVHNNNNGNSILAQTDNHSAISFQCTEQINHEHVISTKYYLTGKVLIDVSFVADFQMFLSFKHAMWIASKMMCCLNTFILLTETNQTLDWCNIRCAYRIIVSFILF